VAQDRLRVSRRDARQRKKIVLITLCGQSKFKLTFQTNKTSTIESQLYSSLKNCYFDIQSQTLEATAEGDRCCLTEHQVAAPSEWRETRSGFRPIEGIPEGCKTAKENSTHYPLRSIQIQTNIPNKQNKPNRKPAL